MTKRTHPGEDGRTIPKISGKQNVFGRLFSHFSRFYLGSIFHDNVLAVLSIFTFFLLTLTAMFAWRVDGMVDNPLHKAVRLLALVTFGLGLAVVVGDASPATTLLTGLMCAGSLALLIRFQVQDFQQL